MDARVMTTGRSVSPLVGATEAARTLGVSAKALRVYERAGLIHPRRSPAGWRLYGTREIEAARDIVAWRRLGVGLADIASLQRADAAERRRRLRAYQAALEARARAVAAVTDQLGDSGRYRGAEPAPALRRRGRGISLPLPWPWDGERFILAPLGPLTYLTGPVGSGKTRLAHALAEAIPGASFVGLDRLDDDASAAHRHLRADRRLAARVEQAMARMVADGATASPALRALLVALESKRRGAVVVDLVEHGLDDATQRALMRALRRWNVVPLVLMTRSTSVLDLAQATESDVIIYCPANHSVPMQVVPRPGAPGMEALDTCLASPAVRARTAGAGRSLSPA